MTQQEVDALFGPQPVYKSSGNHLISQKIKQNG